MDDTYRQITDVEREEVKVKGSRFIGESVPVTTLEEFSAAIEAVKKREYNATHHCWAYRIGVKRDVFRYSDDGEPSGTAGQPILRHIDSLELTNTLVVVTRYYGGTKLGTGGLIRAYGDAARLVLAKSLIVERILRKEISIYFAYEDTSAAMHTISKYDVQITHSEYSDETRLQLAVRQSHVESFLSQFVENLSGRGKFDTYHSL